MSILRRDAPPTPGIAIAIAVTGCALFALAFILLISGIHEASVRADPSFLEFAYSASAAVLGILMLGLSAVITKLTQIEFRLRGRTVDPE